mmetsp:Transcript_137118/g.438457  ORF Transcript_137118/g.438457 Transcript_137118/m.438457 type:complete len:262 (+) Transcript_137118:146-931(+)
MRLPTEMQTKTQTMIDRRLVPCRNQSDFASGLCWRSRRHSLHQLLMPRLQDRTDLLRSKVTRCSSPLQVNVAGFVRCLHPRLEFKRCRPGRLRLHAGSEACGPSLNFILGACEECGVAAGLRLPGSTCVRLNSQEAAHEDRRISNLLLGRPFSWSSLQTHHASQNDRRRDLVHLATPRITEKRYRKLWPHGWAAAQSQVWRTRGGHIAGKLHPRDRGGDIAGKLHPRENHLRVLQDCRHGERDLAAVQTLQGFTHAQVLLF